MREGINYFYRIAVIVATVVVPIVTAYTQIVHPAIKKARNARKAGQAAGTKDCFMVTLTDKDSGRTFSAFSSASALIIGRSEDESDLSLAFDGNNRISRQHCRIRKDEDDFFIKNYSVNGLSLNGRRLIEDEERKLSDLDEIMLADRSFRVRIASEK